MAQTIVTFTPFTGRTKEDFNQFEEKLRGINGVAGIAGAQQANFLHLHLKDDALSFFSTIACGSWSRLISESCCIANTVR